MKNGIKKKKTLDKNKKLIVKHTINFFLAVESFSTIYNNCLYKKGVLSN